MDILIKGEWIKPPSKDDYLDIRLYGTGEVVVNGDLDREAVAIFVPEHGDLIDRDALLNELKKYYKVGEIAEVGEVACFIEEAEVVLERTT